MPATTTLRVRFDEALWLTDMRAGTPTARRRAGEWRQRIGVLRGIPQGELLACRAADDDGLDLPRCVKTRIPNPASASIEDSPWGAILDYQADQAGLYLRVLAFGLRHPEAIGSMKLSVYAIAHDRLFPTR
jgi:hypothetical protein